MFELYQSELVWFVFGLLFVLAELMLPGFVIIFFGIGAWITAIIDWVGLVENFTGQLAVFLVSSVLSLVLFRKKASTALRGKVVGKLSSDEELDNVKGQKVKVIADIQPNNNGKVELYGTVWNAEAEVPLNKGLMVEVVERNNLVLKVKPIQ